MAFLKIIDGNKSIAVVNVDNITCCRVFESENGSFQTDIMFSNSPSISLEGNRIDELEGKLIDATSLDYQSSIEIGTADNTETN